MERKQTTDKITRMSLKNIMISEKKPNPKNNNIWFHLYDIQEQAKLIYDGENQIVVTHVSRDSSWKGHEGGFWVACHLLFLESGTGYTGVSNL